MCLIFISFQHHQKYKLVVAANRDEFYKRKTAPAHFWEDHPHIVGGRDLEAGGTWLAFSKKGKISMVTNFRDPKNINPAAPSRGQLVSDFLVQPTPAHEYLKKLQPEAPLYNGFNLLAGTPDELYYFSNYGNGIQKLTPGNYGLSNHLLETPWPKIKKGKKKFQEALQQTSLTPEYFFELLYDAEIATDESLPDTGVGIERERILSSMFIKSPGYGTRCSTVVLVDHENHVTFSERVYNVTDFSYTTETFTFNV